MTMNIYEFSNSEGESDWVFAPDIQQAKDFYLDFTDCGDLIGFEVKEVPKDEWKELYVLDINEPEPDDDEVDYNTDDYVSGFKILESFSEYAERNTATDMIATTHF